MTNPGLPEIPVAALPADAVLLDVREDDEWAAGHAPQAVHIPMSQLAGRLADVPAAEPLYVICRTGGRSARVTNYLNNNGWDAINVDGGMSMWAAGGAAIVADDDRIPEIL